ncbi:MAG: DUF2752 domain-containing protein [Phycisphaerae bacterium]|nr:DUF2752 domain-containing protein [Phycisphaerae bacterium]
MLAAGVLALAGSLTPAPSGHGTHTQLGLSQCSAEMLLSRPCPSCGMTTAFAFFVRGDLAAALHAQVLGTILAATMLMAALGAATTVLTGVTFGPVLRRIFVERIAWLYLLVGLGLGSWALKAFVTG